MIKVYCVKMSSMLSCFNTVFQRLYRYFQSSLKWFFHCAIAIKIFTSNWLWIESCENGGLSKIDITMITIKNFENDKSLILRDQDNADNSYIHD